MSFTRMRDEVSSKSCVLGSRVEPMNYSTCKDDVQHNSKVVTYLGQKYQAQSTEDKMHLPLNSLDDGPSMLKHWRNSNMQSKTNIETGKTKIPSEDNLTQNIQSSNIDFFEEIDAKMSVNSFEIPDQQAKHVRDWLDHQIDTPHRLASYRAELEEKSSEKGNVIGIRGFPSCTLSGDYNQDRFNELRDEHIKLQSDYQRVLAQLEQIKKQTSDKKGNNRIRVFRSKSCRHKTEDRSNFCRCHRCNFRSSSADIITSSPRLDIIEDANVNEEQKDELDHLQHELRSLELKLQQKDQVYEENLTNVRLENERIKRQYDDCRTELDNMKNQMKNLSYTPTTRALLTLRDENTRLKDVNHADIVKYEQLIQDYALLENRIENMTTDQRCLNEQRDDEMNKLMNELCRHQVHKQKLETILETERQVKSELGNTISLLKEDNERLRDNLKDMEQDLSRERLRTKANDSNERKFMEAEILRWQDKYEQLRGEINTANELLRSTKGKMTMLEMKHRNELEALVEKSKHESDRTRVGLVRAESEISSLRARLMSLQERMNTCESEKKNLNDELIAAKRQIELESSNRKVDSEVLERFKRNEALMGELKSQLKDLESEKRRLTCDLDQERKQSEQAKQKISHYKHCCDLQQRAFDELKETKDKELNQLRVSLNLERYNRQVALKAVERELRASLKELETVKCRFSSRLVRHSNEANTSHKAGDLLSTSGDKAATLLTITTAPRATATTNTASVR